MKPAPYIVCTLLAAHSLCLHAQAPADTLQRTMIVETEYAPVIDDAAKIQLLPPVPDTRVDTRQVEYVTTARPQAVIPRDTIEAYVADPHRSSPCPAYIRLGYGMAGRADIDGRYRLRLSPNDRLDVALSLTGFETDVDLTAGSDASEWESRRYDARARLAYGHRTDALRVDAALYVDNSNLNYRPDAAYGRQRLTDAGLHIGLGHHPRDGRLRVVGETNLMRYTRRCDPLADEIGETMVRTAIDATVDVDESRSAGVSVRMDNLFYGDDVMEDHTDIFVNPHYTLRGASYDLRLGAHVDVAIGFGHSVRLAPDVYAAYHLTTRALLYARATGGRRSADLRGVAAVSPYLQLSAQPDAAYEPVNAAIGLRTSPADGWWLHVYGGYQLLRGDYTELMGTSDAGSAVTLYEADLSDLYAGAELTYTYKDLFALRALATYRSWSADSDTPDAQLAYKPQLQAELSIDAQPVSGLHLAVGYRHESRPEVDNEHAEPIAHLFARASYEPFAGVAIYARAENLLNQSYAVYNGYTAPGLHVYGGLVFRF